MKKRGIVLLVFLLMLMLCFSCNSKTPTPEPSPQPTPVTPVPTPTPQPTPTPEVDLSGVTFVDVTVEYNGEVQALVVENVPEGIDVQYTNNENVNVGEYVVMATLSQDEEVLKTLEATLTITKRKATVTIDDKESSITNIQELTYTVEGVIGDDDLGIELSVDNSTSGKKEINGTWSNNNYDVTFITGTYTFTEALFDSSSLTANSAFLPNFAPFSLYDTTYFADTVVTKISFPFHSFAAGYDANSSNLYVPVYVVKNDFTTKQADCTVENGKLVILDCTNKLVGVSQGDWVTFDNLNIEVGSDETLAFGDANMTVMPGFLRNNETYGFWNRIFSTKGANKHSLVFTIEGYKNTSIDGVDLSGIKFEDLTVEYDGEIHSLVAKNIPEGIEVEYMDNENVNAGKYTITANLFKDSKLIKELEATLTITKRKATVTIDDQLGDNIDDLTYTVEGVIGDDDLGIELSIDTSSSGKKEIKGTWKNENYSVTFVAGTYILTEKLFDSSSLTANSPFLPNYAPFSLYDTTYFSDTVVTKISFPFHSFAAGYDAYSSNLYVPVYVVKNDFTTKQADCTVENGKLVILDCTNKLVGVSQGTWITFDNLNIEVGAGETLAFGDKNMTVMPGFLRNNGIYGFWNQIFGNKGGNNHSLIFTIEGYKLSSGSGSGFVEDDTNYISFLGDSISTYTGISNSTSYNPTISSNAVWYPNNNYTGANLAASDTWWQQTADQLGYELCVNNSWSGSVVNTSQTYNVRAKNLHNVSMHAPDVIVVFIGVNDYAANTAVGTYDGTTTAPANPQNFSEAYGRMLQTIKETYPEAEVFCCTFLSDRKRMSSDVNGAGISIGSYLTAIETIATNMGVNVIDLYNDSGINGSNISSYTVDRLHPNAAGMDLITNTVVSAINSVLGKE